MANIRDFTTSALLAVSGLSLIGASQLTGSIDCRVFQSETGIQVQPVGTKSDNYLAMVLLGLAGVATGGYGIYSQLKNGNSAEGVLTGDALLEGASIPLALPASATPAVIIPQHEQPQYETIPAQSIQSQPEELALPTTPVVAPAPATPVVAVNDETANLAPYQHRIKALVAKIRKDAVWLLKLLRKPLVLFRGCQGSGKTTAAACLAMIRTLLLRHSIIINDPHGRRKNPWPAYMEVRGDGQNYSQIAEGMQESIESIGSSDSSIPQTMMWDEVTTYSANIDKDLIAKFMVHALADGRKDETFHVFMTHQDTNSIFGGSGARAREASYAKVIRTVTFDAVNAKDVPSPQGILIGAEFNADSSPIQETITFPGWLTPATLLKWFPELRTYKQPRRVKVAKSSLAAAATAHNASQEVIGSLLAENAPDLSSAALVNRLMQLPEDIPSSSVEFGSDSGDSAKISDQVAYNAIVEQILGQGKSPTAVINEWRMNYYTGKELLIRAAQNLGTAQVKRLLKDRFQIFSGLTI